VQEKLFITISLHMALQSLAETEGPIPVFVRQLCINQGNATEKGDQIKMMEAIYTKASPVVAWFGPSTALVDQYIRFVESLDRHPAM
jgi:hypothetical protein